MDAIKRRIDSILKRLIKNEGLDVSQAQQLVTLNTKVTALTSELTATKQRVTELETEMDTKVTAVKL